MTKVEVKPNIDTEQAAFDAVNLLVNEAKTRYNESLQPLIDLAVECEAPVLKGTLRERAIVSVTNREILHNFLRDEVLPLIEKYSTEMGACGRAATACKEAHLQSVQEYAKWAQNQATIKLAELYGVSLEKAGAWARKYYNENKTLPEILEQFKAQKLAGNIENRRKEMYEGVNAFREKYQRWMLENPVASSASLLKMRQNVTE